MIRVYRLLRFKTKFLAFLLLFFVAVYVIAGRYALAILPEYRASLEQYLSEQLGHPVLIERISSKWVGFDPVISIDGLTVNGEGQGHIGVISARLATLKSILKLAPRFKSVQLINSNVTIQHIEKGSLLIAGMSVTSDESNAREKSGLQDVIDLFDGAEINLHNNQFEFTGRAKNNQPGKKRVWRLPSISMNYRGNEVFASGKVLQPDGTQPLLSFSLHGFGMLSDKPVRGTLFFEARSSEFFDELIKVYDWNGLAIQDIDASSRVWIDFENLSIKKVTGDVQVSNLNWKIAEKSLPPITNGASRFHWFSQGDTQQLTLTGLGFNWADHACRSTDMLLNLSSKSTLVYVNKMKVSCLSDLSISLGWLSPKLQQRLETSQPEGWLENILFVQESSPPSQNDSQPDEAPSFTFEAELQEVSLESFYSTPLGRGINGYIHANSEGGEVFFRSDHFELGFPTLFLEPWKMSFAEGNVNWRIDGEDVEVFSDGIRLYFPDESLVYGDFSLSLNPKGREDMLYLSIAMQDLPIERATSFVPYHAVGNGLYDWLDRSLRGGRVTEGIYVGYGSTEDDDAINNFTSSIFLQTNQGQVSFAEDWPDITGLDSSIVIQNGELSIESTAAKIHETDLNDLSVFLPERDKSLAANQVQNNSDSHQTMAEPMLSANAKVRVEKAELDYWLQESPISQQTRAIADQIQIQGAVNVDIDLSIPVSGEADLAYDIRAYLNENTITHLDSDLPFKQVNGELLVSSSEGILAKSIRSELLGQNALLDINQDFSKESVIETLRHYEGGKFLYDETRVGHDVLISLNSILNIPTVLEHYQQEAIPGVDGELAFTADLRIPADDDRYPVLAIKSDLIGLKREWPEPLTKLVDEKESFWLDLVLKPGQIHLHAGLEPGQGPVTEVDALFMDQKLIFSDVQIGGAETHNPITEGISISAKLDEFDVEPWRAFITSLNETSSDEESVLLKQVALDVKQLNAFGFHFEQVSSQISPIKDSWQIALSGESVEGLIQLASENTALNIDLERIKLPEDPEAEQLDQEPETAKGDASFIPSQLPEMIFSAKHIIYQGQDIGAWSTRLEPYEGGVYFRNIQGSLAKNIFEGQIDWQGDEESSHSVLTLNAKGEDIAKVISAFSLPETLSSKELAADIALVWNGSPADFELGKVSGKLAFKLKDGVLYTSDKKTGFLRVFGILNAETIMRRLKLDFSDLYKSGLAYDEFSLKSAINEGMLTLEEPLRITGPSGKYVLKGKTNLAEKTLAMDMRVELPITQNVPLAALMLGAPQVGGAVWLVDKLLGEPLSNITSASYDVKGTWDDPKVELKETGSKSK